MTAKKKQMPSLWRRPFGHFPSLFEGEEEFFPEILPFSEEEGLSVSEDNGALLVEAAVPGLKPEEIDISIDAGHLWIKGEKIEEEKDKSRKYYKKSSQSYSYCVALPDTIDENQEVEASCEDGVVKITFSKKKSVEPKKIKIKK